jgi:hypothetical protein
VFFDTHPAGGRFPVFPRRYHDLIPGFRAK